MIRLFLLLAVHCLGGLAFFLGVVWGVEVILR